MDANSSASANIRVAAGAVMGCVSPTSVQSRASTVTAFIWGRCRSMLVTRQSTALGSHLNLQYITTLQPDAANLETQSGTLDLPFCPKMGGADFFQCCERHGMSNVHVGL